MGTIRTRKGKDGSVSYYAEVRRKGYAPAYDAFERRKAEKEARKAVKRGEVASVEEALAPAAAFGSTNCAPCATTASASP